MGNITLDVAKEHIHNHETLLPLRIQDGNVYTNADMSVENFEEYYLNDDIDNLVPLDEPYKGTMPRLSYHTPVVGRNLREITEYAITEYNDPYEAIIWLKNVIESIGITILVQYSIITTIMITNVLKQHDKFSVHFKKAKTFFNFLLEKFRDYRLRREPIDQIILIFNEYNQSPKLEENKQKFIKLSKSFAERFTYCTYLVKMPVITIIDKKLFCRSTNITTLKDFNTAITYCNNKQLDKFYSYVEFTVKILKGKH
ncbi:uncharacterized protein LOC126899216 [Daktulosphaira vitifoliae]|uniref:uncharacterized protein LOC126899216 n=1 Tax=Daktulosphaira vitifoliae TaxID=58002 RepID=UPI0021AA2B92|nr:uncharacterized protein LOC126899216 [Daktulosphaira vitifoliae]